MFSYNTSVHSAHGFTPHELIFGQKARLPSEFETRIVEKTYEMYLDELIFKLNDTHYTITRGERAIKEIL